MTPDSPDDSRDIGDAMDSVASGDVHPDVVRAEFGDEEGFQVLLNAAVATRERSRTDPVEDNIPTELPF